jgi:hypothetical protein
VNTAFAACALVLGFASPVLAQTAHPLGRVPPEDVLTSIRSMGLDPATRPLLRGRVYALRAFDPSHAEKRVLVDARSGEVLSVRAVADGGPAEAPYSPRYGRYQPPRPPARVAEAPGAEPILDEPLFPRAGRGAPAASAQRSAALAPTPAPKVQPAPAAGTAQDSKAPVGTSPVPAGETASGSAPAAPLASADVLAAAPSTPGKSIPAPVAAKPDSAKPATQFVPVAPLE